jgi:hypothetical protein
MLPPDPAPLLPRSAPIAPPDDVADRVAGSGAKVQQNQYCCCVTVRGGTGGLRAKDHRMEPLKRLFF